MIRKTRTDIRAEIDSQYEILSQMIEDIADRYQEDGNSGDRLMSRPTQRKE